MYMYIHDWGSYMYIVYMSVEIYYNYMYMKLTYLQHKHVPSVEQFFYIPQDSPCTVKQQQHLEDHLVQQLAEEPEINKNSNPGL